MYLIRTCNTVITDVERSVLNCKFVITLLSFVSSLIDVRELEIKVGDAVEVN